MRPTNLRRHSGDSRPIELTLVDAAGVPLDPTALTIVFTAKARLRDADLDAVIRKETPTDVTIVDAPSGRIQVQLVPADTTVTEATVLYWDVRAKDTLGGVETLAGGRLSIFLTPTQVLP